MEIMIPFPQCQQADEAVVASRDRSGEWLLPSPMREGIHCERAVKYNNHAPQPSIQESAPKIPPAHPGHQSRKYQTHSGRQRDEIAVLPHDHGVALEIGDVHIPVTGGWSH
jgi:hypothetical protein